MSNRRITISAAVSLLALGRQLNAQLLAYESFAPADGSENRPLIGSPTLSTGFFGTWVHSANADASPLGGYVLARTDGPGSGGPGVPGLVSSNFEMFGAWADSSVGRRVDLSAAAFTPYRVQPSGPSTTPTFGVPGTDVWVAMSLANRPVYTDATQDYSMWSGHSLLSFHGSDDVTANPTDSLNISVSWNRGISVGIGASSASGPAIPSAAVDRLQTFVAVQFRYFSDRTRVEVYVQPPLGSDFRPLRPDTVLEFKRGDPGTPPNMLQWNAISWTPTVGGDFIAEYGGRNVGGTVGDLRIGGTYADVAPTLPGSSLPEWIGPSGGVWESAANWSTGTTPSTPADVAIFPAAATPIVVRLDTTVATNGIRFDSVQPYRVEGSGSIAATSGTHGGAQGSRLFDVRQGRHQIAVPVTGDHVATDYQIGAGSFLAVQSIIGGQVNVGGTGELEVKAGTTVQSLTVNDSATATLKTDKPETPALRLTTDLYGGSIRVAVNATLVVASPGSPTSVVDVARVPGVSVHGNLVALDAASGSRPVLVRVDLSYGGYSGELVIGDQGSIDLRTNMLGWTDGDYTSLARSYLRQYDDNAPTPVGLFSCVATDSTALGFAHVSQVPELAGLGVATLVAYTYLGDTNLDGVVDAVDLANLDLGLDPASGLTGWFHGDFNYDGLIDGADVLLFQRGLTDQSQPLGLVAIVPEPFLGSLLAPTLLRRRR